MKGSSVRHMVVKFFGWFLLLQMINISIDPPNLQFTKKNINNDRVHSLVNVSESIYELLSEEFFDNDVPEDEQNDIEKFEKSIDLYVKPTLVHQSVFSFHSLYFSGESDNCFFLPSSPNSPPPKI